jgi:hypothetical protein
MMMAADLKAWRSRAVDAPAAVSGSARDETLRAARHHADAAARALAQRRDLVVLLYHLHTSGPMPSPGRAGSTADRCRYSRAGCAVAEGYADFVPVFLSDIPGLFTSGTVRLDAALLQVSPPDAHGFCSLGTSVDAARAAADTARLVIAEVNERMPRTHGNTFVPLSRFDAFVTTDRPLHEHPHSAETDVERRIGELVADW